MNPNAFSEPGDESRGIRVAMVALRWNRGRLSAAELIQRTAIAVQAVDKKFDKDVMDVKVIHVSEEQQYVQLAVRANFASPRESERMTMSLKEEFGEFRKWYKFWK